MGFKDARYKGFSDHAGARDAFERGPQATGSWRAHASSGSGPKPGTGWAVDAACSGNPGIMEYRGVELATGQELFHKGPFPLATNNIGEFLAIVHALSMLSGKKEKIAVYSDSGTAIGWVKNGKARSKLPRNEKTERIWNLLERAEDWLRQHPASPSLLKWHTSVWGEIPADFGRK